MNQTAINIIEALDRKYGQHLSGYKNEQWITITEARSGATFDGNDGQCDYLAINTWQSKGMQVIGHEIKVSMADWRRELEDPAKADRFARYCRRWWVVMPSDLAKKAKPDIPPKWGLMSVSEKGRITETVRAPAQDPEEPPVWWWIGWLAQLDRQIKRGVRREVDRQVNEKLEAERQRVDQFVEDRVERRLAGVENLTETVDAFRDATGIDLRRTWQPHIDRLAKVWPLAINGTELDHVAETMRRSADLLDALAGGGEA